MAFIYVIIIENTHVYTSIMLLSNSKTICVLMVQSKSTTYLQPKLACSLFLSSSNMKFGRKVFQSLDGCFVALDLGIF